MARLDELERKFEENPRRYFAPLANEYRKAGDAAKAAELCRSQLPDVPGHISGHIVLGQALFDSSDFAGARTALETALALDPENIVALRYLGDIARNTGDTAEAERWYSRTLEADPYNDAATQGLQALRERDFTPVAPEAPAESASPEAATEAPALAALTEGFEPTAHVIEPEPMEVSIEPLEERPVSVAVPDALEEITPAVEAADSEEFGPTAAPDALEQVPSAAKAADSEEIVPAEPAAAIVADPEPAPVEDVPPEDVPANAEFAGDLAISAMSESAEEGTDETQAESAEALHAEAVGADTEVPQVVADETAPPQAAPVERFDEVAHESPKASGAVDAPEPASAGEAIQGEARVAESGAPEAVPGDEAMQAEERVMESAAPFVTETMADLYLEQGYPHEALELLLQLAEQRPEDERLREKVADIESVIAARRDAVVAAARAERAETAHAAVAEVDSSAFAASQDVEAALAFEIPPFLPAEEEAPRTVREMFARMDRARPRPANAVTPRPLSRLRSDFAPMPDPGEAAGESTDDPFAFPDAPRPEQHVARTSGPHPTFNPSTADIDDFEAWLRGLKGP